MPYGPRESLREQAAARRDAYDHAVRGMANDRCEDCGESVKGRAVFECSGKACSTGMLCCAACATLVGEVRGIGGVVHGWCRETKPRWSSVVLVRDGLSSRRKS